MKCTWSNNITNAKWKRKESTIKEELTLWKEIFRFSNRKRSKQASVGRGKAIKVWLLLTVELLLTTSRMCLQISRLCKQTGRITITTHKKRSRTNTTQWASKKISTCNSSNSRSTKNKASRSYTKLTWTTIQLKTRHQSMNSKAAFVNRLKTLLWSLQTCNKLQVHIIKKVIITVRTCPQQLAFKIATRPLSIAWNGNCNRLNCKSKIRTESF